MCSPWVHEDGDREAAHLEDMRALRAWQESRGYKTPAFEAHGPVENIPARSRANRTNEIVHGHELMAV